MSTLDRVTANTVGPSHTGGPVTEKLAARYNARRSGSQRVRVLLHHVNCVEGVAGFELERALGIPPSSARTRRSELEADGLIAPTPERRRTPDGALAVVYSATPLGLRIAAMLRA